MQRGARTDAWLLSVPFGVTAVTPCAGLGRRPSAPRLARLAGGDLTPSLAPVPGVPQRPGGSGSVRLPLARRPGSRLEALACTRGSRGQGLLWVPPHFSTGFPCQALLEKTPEVRAGLSPPSPGAGGAE